MGGFGPQLSLVGRGATYSSIYSASFQAGYFFTPNWSLEVSSAVPLWLTIKITRFSATPPFSEAVLGKLLPGVVPITAVYHFTQFGAIQPYLGGRDRAEFRTRSSERFQHRRLVRAQRWPRCSGRLRLHVQPELRRLFRREEALHLDNGEVDRIRSRSADRYDSRGRHDQDYFPTVAVLNGRHLSLLSLSSADQPCALRSSPRQRFPAGTRRGRPLPCGHAPRSADRPPPRLSRRSCARSP